MNSSQRLPFNGRLEEYQEQAKTLFEGVRSFDEEAEWRFKRTDGFHSHSTPLHQAVCAGHVEVVKLLVKRGARLDIRDTIYHGTPLGWAIHCEKPVIAEYLRAQR